MNEEQAKHSFARADSLHCAGRQEEALVLLGQLLEHFPDEKHVLLARARCLYALGQAEEALRLCDRLAEEQQYVRATELAITIRAGTDSEPASVSEAGRPIAPHRPLLPVLPAIDRRKWLRLAGLAALGTGAVGGAVRGRDVWMGTRTRASEAEWEATRAGLTASFEARHQEKEEVDRLARTKPGYVHRREDWRRTAFQGVPQWESGIYRKVPTLARRKFTMDVYLPMAYSAYPEALFPYLTICMPVFDPGFLGFERWAEKRNVVLIVMNAVSNGTYKRNGVVQDAVLDTMWKTMRLHPRLGFATGVSGGARTSWEMLSRYPRHFAGVLMMAFAGLSTHTFPPHIRVAFLYGRNDFNAKHIPPCVKKLQRKRYQVRSMQCQGGHIMGPLSMRSQLMDWLMEGQAS